MKPAIEPGQCFTVMTDFETVGPGQIVTFSRPETDPATDDVWVMRIVATQGQTVQMISGRLWIDGLEVPTAPAPDYLQAMEREGPSNWLPRCPTPTQEGANCSITRLTETLEGESYEVLDLQPGTARWDNTPPMTVPPGHVFVLGDNRDNAVDSRVPPDMGGPGFIPIGNITGVFDGFL